MATCAGSEFSMAVNYAGALSYLHKSDYVLKLEQMKAIIIYTLLKSWNGGEHSPNGRMPTFSSMSLSVCVFYACVLTVLWKQFFCHVTSIHSL